MTTDFTKHNTSNNFIRNIINEDIKQLRCKQVITRFPPEPNGYLHIGHAKAICHNFGVAQDYQGYCNLRFDDTNPDAEDAEYVQAIQDDIKWLGFKWHADVKFASNYFDKLYEFALWFIDNNLAYVDDLSATQITQYRGTLTLAGQDSPYKQRTIAQNRELFIAMYHGQYADGEKVLRLKIDMHSGNMNLRDPTIYRIKHIPHIRTGNTWCIYPLYDYAHCISDALEGITHSCCSLEFADHRPLYNWILTQLFAANLITCLPQQLEFSRLELRNTVTSKRKLNYLITENLVNGWDDPRLPTLAGLRRRGYSAAGIRLFIERCGIAKSPNLMEHEALESAIRETLENTTKRILVVMQPLKVILTNFSRETTSRSAAFHPKIAEFGTRMCLLTDTILIEQSDFQEHATADFYRLSIGKSVRLRHSYIIKCTAVEQDSLGKIIALHCDIDHTTLNKNPTDYKVKGTIQWVSANLAVPITVRLYQPLLESVTESTDSHVNMTLSSQSVTQITAYAEPAIKEEAYPETVLQFERVGYFVADRYECTATTLIFNHTVSLRSAFLPTAHS